MFIFFIIYLIFKEINFKRGDLGGGFLSGLFAESCRKLEIW